MSAALDWGSRRDLIPNTARPGRRFTLGMLALVGLLVTGCGGDGGNDPVEPDVAPPATVSDLEVTGTTSSTASLEWTAPGDDGIEGTARSYDVRYSMSPINDGNWGAAAQAAGEPTPSAAGATESFTIPGLSEGTVYHITLKTSDEESNLSALSNVVSCTTAVVTQPADLEGHWMLRLVSDIDADPGDMGDCVSISQSGSALTMSSYCFDGSAVGTVVGDSVHFDVQTETLMLTGRVTEGLMSGTWVGEENGEADSGTWTAVFMDHAPDYRDCVEANVDVFCGRTAAGAYVIVAQLDDHESIMAEATLSGAMISGSFPLSMQTFPEEEDEWYTDPLEPGLTISSVSEPPLPLEYTVHLEFTTGGSRDVALSVDRIYDIDLPDCRWQTVFVDDFRSTSLDPRWSLYEGEEDLFVLNGDRLAVDDSDEYTDGPYFIHELSEVNERVRLGCKVETLEMNGDVEFSLVIGDESAVYVFGTWEGLRIVRDSGVEEVLAQDPTFSMAAHQTLWFEASVRGGDLTFAVRDTQGSLVALIYASDDDPVDPSAILFGGEIDGTEGEYLYIDDMTLIECR